MPEKSWLGFAFLREHTAVYIDGYPIECEWCGEDSVHGRLVADRNGFVELWEDCVVCSVRTRVGATQ